MAIIRAGCSLDGPRYFVFIAPTRSKCDPKSNAGQMLRSMLALEAMGDVASPSILLVFSRHCSSITVL